MRLVYIGKNGEVDTSEFMIVYVAPMEALVAEVAGNLSNRLQSYNITVRELNGGHSLTRQQIEETQILVTTPKKWDIVTRKSGDRTYTQSRIKLVKSNDMKDLLPYGFAIHHAGMMLGRAGRSQMDSYGDGVILMLRNSTLYGLRDDILDHDKTLEERRGCNLLNLEINNAWLSVKGLKPMLTLINLRLKFITLDDENLKKVNECFPYLQILILNKVDGLRKTKINLLQLRVCHWAVRFPLYLEIHAPKLVELKLECLEPEYFVLETPLLTQIDLKIDKPGGHVNIQSFICLKLVRMETGYLKGIKQLFRKCQTVRKLELEGFNSFEAESLGKLTVVDIISTFPNVDDLQLGPGAWSQLCRDSYIFCEWRNLKMLSIKLLCDNVDIALLSYVLNFCIPSCEVTVYIHNDIPYFMKKEIIARCTSNFPKYMWKWRVWKEECVDTLFYVADRVCEL